MGDLPVVYWLSLLTGDHHSAFTMRGFLPFLCLLGLALTGPMVDHETNNMVRDMGDAIEAGLMEPTEGEARALFISLTMTSTSTSLATATVTTTVTNSCVAGTFVDCSTTTTTTTTTAATTTTTTTTTPTTTTPPPT